MKIFLAGHRGMVGSSIISLKEGIKSTYKWYLNNQDKLKL